eukprot:TRINITY_DN60935_c0_g1_i1.p1 TRINITY_DN60935_c0_g1~~TRINITY_DN60935_c0_g1_i1.p1  ORF type:complete len:752 (+),score=109.21 TRINITY_DN60935_c0_g1_i1:134-2389(+)
MDESDALSWGAFSTRARVNLLSGAAETPEGDRCASEFLLFDTRQQRLNLCRYTERRTGNNIWQDRCRITPLSAEPEDRALRNPRLPIALSKQHRLFASVEVNAGKARVAVWQLQAARGNTGSDHIKDEAPHGEDFSLASSEMSYALVAEIETDSVDTARSVAWLEAEATPPWLLRSNASRQGDDEVAGEALTASIEERLNAQALLSLGSLSIDSADVAILAVLLRREVLLVALRPSRHPSGGRDTCWTTSPLRPRLQIGFLATCLCWSLDGTQLLVGGAGQMAVFVWRRGGDDDRSIPPSATAATDGNTFSSSANRSSAVDVTAATPHVRQLLCAGVCSEVYAVHGGTFLCRLELRANAADSAELRMPGGHRVSTEGLGSQLVVEMENPQDALNEEEPSIHAATLTSAATGANSAISLGLLSSTSHLQVVPQKQYLLPLRCEPVFDRKQLLVAKATAHAVTSSTGSGGVGAGYDGDPAVVDARHGSEARNSWRLRCGPELEIQGSLVSVASTVCGGSLGSDGGNLVAEGSFDCAPVVRAWKLAPPHRWGRPPGRGDEWRLCGSPINLAGTDGAGGERLRGLALWQSHGGVEVHGVLAAADGTLFDQGNPRELLHRVSTVTLGRVPSSTQAEVHQNLHDVREHSTAQIPGEEVPSRGSIDSVNASHVAASLPLVQEELKGIRQELGGLRQSFDAFRGDFARLISAIEGLRPCSATVPSSATAASSSGGAGDASGDKDARSSAGLSGERSLSG